MRFDSPMHKYFSTVHVPNKGQKGGKYLAYMCVKGPYECDACGFCTKDINNSDDNEESEE